MNAQTDLDFRFSHMIQCSFFLRCASDAFTISKFRFCYLSHVTYFLKDLASIIHKWGICVIQNNEKDCMDFLRFPFYCSDKKQDRLRECSKKQGIYIGKLGA